MRTFNSRPFWGIAALLLAVIPHLGLAQATGASQTTLTLVHGPDSDDRLELTLADLEEMPQTTIMTANEFIDGIVAYQGPLARDVVKLFGLDTSDTIRFSASNNYSVDIPTRDLLEYDVVLALRANGERLSRRTRGPIWLMYPISDNPELRNPIFNSRLIWQVERMEAL